ncbi:MAG: PIN domain-containing protein [Planctomycetaceae bacterium]|nr:PIN domain-containing protein [Planctomycetaceae bacterium]
MLRLVGLDTGPLAALFIPDDPHHEQAMAFVSSLKVPAFTTMPIVTEVLYLLNFSSRNQARFLEWVGRGAIDVVSHDVGEWERYAKLIAKYSDLPADFADVSLVVACERKNTRRVASTDSDFGVYRYKDHYPFDNLFSR